MFISIHIILKAFIFGEIMKKIFIGVIFLASFGLVNNVFGQVAAPLITPGSLQTNPAVNFWKETFTASVTAGSSSLESGSSKVKGNSRNTSVRLSGKSSNIGFGVDISDSHTDYDDLSTNSYNYTENSIDTNSQEFQIAPGAEFIAIGAGFSGVDYDNSYKDNSTTSYDKLEGSSITFGFSLKFSEIYLGYFSAQNSIKRKIKNTSFDNDFPSLKTSSNGFGIGLLLESKFDIHAEVYNVEESSARVDDGSASWGSDELKATGITLEIVADLLNFGLIYQRTSYKENLYPDLLEDYEREQIAYVIGLSFNENLNISYKGSTDKYEQNLKDSSDIYIYLDETSNAVSLSYSFK